MTHPLTSILRNIISKLEQMRSSEKPGSPAYDAYSDALSMCRQALPVAEIQERSAMDRSYAAGMLNIQFVIDEETSRD